MKEIWDAYEALYTWKTAIPIAFYAAIAIAFMDYTFSSQSKRSLYRGSIGFVLAYAFVWLLIGSKLNIDAMWWSDKNSRWTVALILVLIIGITFGIMRITVFWKTRDIGKSKTSVILSYIFLLSLFTPFITFAFVKIFTIGDILFPAIHYILYITSLIGFPAFSVVAAILIFSKLDRPGVPFTVFCYLTLSACAALMYFLSLSVVSYIAPFLFLSGPFVLITAIFHFRQTIGIWVGGICGLIAVTSIQLIMVKYPLFAKIRDLIRTSDLTWILVIYAASTVSLGIYYLRTLYRKRVDEEVEDIHPLLPVGAVAFNVCFLYLVIVSSKPLLWGAWFTGINLLIGLIILFGRMRVLTQ